MVKVMPCIISESIASLSAHNLVYTTTKLK